MQAQPPKPTFDVDLQAMWRDPYPTFKEMRARAPIAYVPQLGGWALTKRDDIYHWEKEIDTFSSVQPQGLMSRLMGTNMMRKDGKDHSSERKVFFGAVSPKAVKEIWTERFGVLCDAVLDALEPFGAADLGAAFALPYAGACLCELTGLTNAKPTDMDAWSQALIEGISNYVGNAEVEARCKAAVAAIDAAIDARLPEVKRAPDQSLLSAMIHGGLPEESVRANIKLTISGGQNEPRKAIIGVIWALLTHPGQLEKIQAGEATFHQAFDEYCRWIAPIGMSPRRIARPVTIGDAQLNTDDRAFLFFGSANRDEAHFANGDAFDISRDTSKSIPFGAGPHFCAGAWASRAMIADVAVPRILARFKNLRLDPARPPQFGGWAFRGLLHLHAQWAPVTGSPVRR
ncbi:MAG: hypothetical protein RL291_495 [Pseudomonadota bacterium]